MDVTLVGITFIGVVPIGNELIGNALIGGTMISAVLITTAPNSTAICITAKPTHALIVHIHFTLQPSLKSAPRCSTKVELPIDTLISAHRVRGAVHGDHPAAETAGYFGMEMPFSTSRLISRCRQATARTPIRTGAG
jgi:hypothetical protein